MTDNAKPLSAEGLAELASLDRYAELGPWIIERSTEFSGKNWLLASMGADHDGENVYVTTDRLHASECRGNGPTDDAAFIVAARNAMPRLLATLAELKEALERAHFVCAELPEMQRERDEAVKMQALEEGMRVRIEKAWDNDRAALAERDKEIETLREQLRQLVLDITP